MSDEAAPPDLSKLTDEELERLAAKPDASTYSDEELELIAGGAPRLPPAPASRTFFAGQQVEPVPPGYKLTPRASASLGDEGSAFGGLDPQLQHFKEQESAALARHRQQGLRDIAYPYQMFTGTPTLLENMPGFSSPDGDRAKRFDPALQPFGQRMGQLAEGAYDVASETVHALDPLSAMQRTLSASDIPAAKATGGGLGMVLEGVGEGVDLLAGKPVAKLADFLGVVPSTTGPLGSFDNPNARRLREGTNLVAMLAGAKGLHKGHKALGEVAADTAAIRALAKETPRLPPPPPPRVGSVIPPDPARVTGVPGATPATQQLSLYEGAATQPVRVTPRTQAATAARAADPASPVVPWDVPSKLLEVERTLRRAGFRDVMEAVRTQAIDLNDPRLAGLSKGVRSRLEAAARGWLERSREASPTRLTEAEKGRIQPTRPEAPQHGRLVPEPAPPPFRNRDLHGREVRPEPMTSPTTTGLEGPVPTRTKPRPGYIEQRGMSFEEAPAREPARIPPEQASPLAEPKPIPESFPPVEPPAAGSSWPQTRAQKRRFGRKGEQGAARLPSWDEFQVLGEGAKQKWRDLVGDESHFPGHPRFVALAPEKVAEIEAAFGALREADPTTPFSFEAPEPPPSAPFPPSPKKGSGIGDRIVYPHQEPKKPIRQRVTESYHKLMAYFEKHDPLERMEIESTKHGPQRKGVVPGKRQKAGPAATADALQGRTKYAVERLWETGRYYAREVDGKLVETKIDAPMPRLREVAKKGDMEALSEYVVARRQQARYSGRAEMGVTDAQALKKIAEVDADMPHVKAAAEAMNSAFHTVWDAARDWGAIPEKQWAASANDFYVPIARYFGESSRGPIGGSSALGRPTIKGVKGGKQLMRDPIPRSFERLMQMEQIVDRARVGRKAVETFDNNPGVLDGFMEEVKKGTSKDFDTIFEEKIAEAQREFHGLTEPEILDVARDRAIGEWAEKFDGKHVSSYQPSGRKRTLKINDPTLVDALAQSPEVSNLLRNPVGKAANIASRTKRLGIIDFSTSFLAKQVLWMDLMNFAVSNPSKLRKMPMAAVKGFYDSVVGTLNEWTRRFSGKDWIPEAEKAVIYDDIGPMHFSNLDRLARSGFSIKGKKGVLPATGRAVEKVGQIGADVFRSVQETGQAIYRRAATRTLLDDWVEAGEWKPGQPLSFDQTVQLIERAHRVGGSFRGGSKLSGEVNKVIAFWKASERIPLDMRHFLRSNPKAYVKRAFLVSVVPRVMIWYANKDEEWYRNRVGWRRHAWNISESLSLPLVHPADLLGAFVESVLRYSHDKGGTAKEEALTFAESFAEQLPSWSGAAGLGGVEMVESGDVGRSALRAGGQLVPDIARPAAEIGTGVNFFTGRDVNPRGRASDRLKGVRPELVTREYIAPWVEDLSKLANSYGVKITPAEIDTVARGHFGTAAKYATRAEIPNPEAADDPWLGWARPRIKESRIVDEFFELRNTVLGEQAAFREYRDRGDDVGMEETFLPPQLKMLNKIDKRMKALLDEYKAGDVDVKAEKAKAMEDIAKDGLEFLKDMRSARDRFPPRPATVPE